MVATARNIFFSFFSIIWLFVFGIQTTQAAPGAARHGGKISRAQFATKMDQREPVDDVVFVDDTATEIFFFSEVLYMTGHKIVHRWEHEGREVSRVSFDIGGPRWRVFSRKSLDEEVKGKWTVLVTDEDGWPLTSKVFVFGEAHKNKQLDAIMHGKQDEGAAPEQDKQQQAEDTEKTAEGENVEQSTVEQSKPAVN